MVCQYAFDLCDPAAGESIVLPKLYRTHRTVQIEHSLMTAPDRMHMGRSMVVRVDNNAQSARSEDRRQDFIIS